MVTPDALNLGLPIDFCGSNQCRTQPARRPGFPLGMFVGYFAGVATCATILFDSSPWATFGSAVATVLVVFIAVRRQCARLTGPSDEPAPLSSPEVADPTPGGVG